MDFRLHGLTCRAPELVLFLYATTTLSGDGIEVLVLVSGVFVLIRGAGVGDGQVFEISLLLLVL